MHFFLNLKDREELVEFLKENVSAIKCNDLRAVAQLDNESKVCYKGYREAWDDFNTWIKTSRTSAKETCRLNAELIDRLLVLAAIWETVARRFDNGGINL